MKRWHYILLILLATAASYANSLSVPFLWDGTYFIAENPAVRDLSYFFDLDKLEGSPFRHAIKMRWAGYLSFALNFRIHGLDVTGYHLVNVLIHMGCALLVYALIRLLFETPFLKGSASQMTGNSSALFAALLFAVHPIQSEAVTYIFQRLASLAALFYLGSAVLYIAFRLDTNRKRQTAWYVSSLICAVLAMKTKENTFTLPFTLLFIEWMFLPGKLLKRFAAIAPFALTLLIIPLSLMGTGQSLAELAASVGPSTRGPEDYTRIEYLLTQLVVILKYLRLTVLPVGQNADHFVAVEISLSSLRVLGSLILHGVLLMLGGYGWVRSRIAKSHAPLRLVTFGICWFYLTMSVESSIVPLPRLMSEYRMYLPSAGLFMAITAFILASPPAVLVLRVRKSAVIALSVIVMACTGATISRNTVWQNDLSLWQDVLEKNPLSGTGHNNLGLALMERDAINEAIRNFERASVLSPMYADPYNNLGIAYARLGRAGHAIDAYERAISLNPTLYNAYNNMGNVYRSLDEPVKAAAAYRTAVSLNPAYAEAHSNLGATLAVMGRYKEARNHLERAVSLKPEFAGGHFNLGILYLQINEREKARRELETVIRLVPSDKETKELLNVIDQQKDHER